MSRAFQFAVLSLMLCPFPLWAQGSPTETVDISEDLEYRGALGLATGMDFDFSPTGDTAASLTMEGITVWSIKTWEPIKEIPLNKKGRHVRYSPDGKLLACVGFPGLFLWSTADWAPIRKLKTGLPSPSDMTFSSDGKRLYVSGHSSSVLAWDTATWKRKKTVLSNVLVDIKGIKNTGNIAFVEISPNGKLAVTGGLTRDTRIWKKNKKQRWKGVLGLEETPSHFAQQARFSKDGRILGIAGSGRLRLFDVDKGKVRHEIDLDPADRKSGTLPVGVEFSADGATVYTIGHLFQAWDVKTGKRLEKSELGNYVHGKGGPAFVYGDELLRSPDDVWMAVRLHHHPIRIYKVKPSADD